MLATDQENAVAIVATHFVDSGRVVPGIEFDTDAQRARSWWWPLPSATDRPLIIQLLQHSDLPDTAAGHTHVANALAQAVDNEVRRRLMRDNIQLGLRRPGRPQVAEAWLRSLATLDPWLPTSIDPVRVESFATAVCTWVQSGAVALGRARLALRITEPEDHDMWRVDLLVQDADEPSLTVGIELLWSGHITVATDAVHDVIAGLARMARVAPELAGMLDEAEPAGISLTSAELLSFVSLRIESLADVGIEVTLPMWWTRRGRIKLRAKARPRNSKSSGSSGGVSGIGMEQMVDFSWEAALGDVRLTKAELLKLRKSADAKQSLVRLRGEWVTVDAAEIEALLRHVGTSSEASAAELLRSALGLPGVMAPDGLEVEGVIATGWLGALLDDAVHATITPIATPSQFQGTLRAYQERGVGWMAFLGRLGLGACLADDMGLGKTAQLIATLLADPVPGPTLVLCPVSVLGNWARELERFTPHLKVLIHHGATRVGSAEGSALADADVVLSTYSLVSRDLAMLQSIAWVRLVLDEAQQIKNPGTAQTKAVAALRAPRRIALTGTPVENRLSELWSIMHVLNPGLLGTQSSFRTTFAAPIEKHSDEEATAILRRITTPFVLRRLKSDRSIITDLPDKIEMVQRCPLTSEQATLYQAVVDELLEASEQTDGIARQGLVLAGLSKLKQVCNHPAHFLGDGSALPGRSGKLDRVEELLDEIISAQNKVLCFTQYAEWGHRLVPYLTRRYGMEPLWLHGGVSRRKRDDMVQRFAEPDGPPIFLLSLKAGGTGLNLTAASHVIHLDRWWNPAVEDQATDRAYRIGQQHTVLVHKLVSTGTIEERIDDMITSKRALAGRVVGTGEQWLTQLSTDDLRQAIELR